jgi:hypothetical protein
VTPQERKKWNKATEPYMLVGLLLGDAEWQPTRAMRRKLRLFGCACCRRVWDLLPTAEDRRKVEAAERYADGLLSDSERARLWQRTTPPNETPGRRPGDDARWAAHFVLHREIWPAAVSTAAWAVAAWSRVSPETPGPEKGLQCHLLRDIIGPLGESVRAAPAWLRCNGGAVRTLAEAIYQERRFEDLPVLADALEEAGCTDRGILEHCRAPGEHARGCWLVDGLLGRP